VEWKKKENLEKAREKRQKVRKSRNLPKKHSGKAMEAEDEEPIPPDSSVAVREGAAVEGMVDANTARAEIVIEVETETGTMDPSQ
jgi:hypothetical protein